MRVEEEESSKRERVSKKGRWRDGGERRRQEGSGKGLQ